MISGSKSSIVSISILQAKRAGLYHTDARTLGSDVKFYDFLSCLSLAGGANGDDVELAEGALRDGACRSPRPRPQPVPGPCPGPRAECRARAGPRAGSAFTGDRAGTPVPAVPGPRPGARPSCGGPLAVPACLGDNPTMEVFYPQPDS